MRFYYENSLGDCGYFTETNLIRAIYSAWNIDAELYLLKNGLKTIDYHCHLSKQIKLIFAPLESNKTNSKLLKEFGYYMADGGKYREIKRIDNNEVVKYDYDKVMQLII